ncbi:NADH-quinone oxidoreductase subunit C [Salmonirosea aquatica]|uniref:NADH-quinone oxidoreductase subunit C n=1 Tax=Salmonirosea aquatica TaxID=2654236 RepID=A0A7C9FR13_9BACT|nr:NADH-quinone oxidoreductase subunit C [Cytophagaceae bacterium SJW1-29]
MDFPAIHSLLTDCLGADVISEAVENVPQPFLVVPAVRLAEVAEVLYRHEQLYFDHLACITALDNGPEKGTMEVLYHFASIPYGHTLVLKVVLARNGTDEPLPVIPTLSHLWRTADWHEREAYDLLGIRFEDHPDLRRILLPADWEGHPLRKDYEAQELYHGIRVKFEDRKEE